MAATNDRAGSCTGSYGFKMDLPWGQYDLLVSPPSFPFGWNGESETQILFTWIGRITESTVLELVSSF